MLNWGSFLHIKTWKVAIKYWFSTDKIHAWLLLITIIILTTSIVVLNILLNKWQTNFYTELQHFNHDGFLRSLVEFVLIVTGLVVISGYQIYAQLKLQLSWRQYLTAEYLKLWLFNKNYYKVNLTNSKNNADQRISDDIHSFITNTITLFVNLYKQIISMICFIMILWNFSSYLAWSALAYSIIGTYITVKTGRPLIRMNIEQQHYEAEFRSSLMRLTENDESIALYNGERHENNNFIQTFSKIVQNFSEIVKLNKQITQFSAAYSQISFIFAFLIASPLYFNGIIKLGEMFEISGAYWYVHSAFSYIVDSFVKIAEWRSTLTRLNLFLNEIQQTQRITYKNKNYRLTTNNNSIEVEDLTIYRPDSTILIKNLNFNISHTNKLLITGPPGCGKSILLKTLAGIWPFYQGKIFIPNNQQLFFLPQKLYNPHNTLREILKYPGFSQSITDNKILEILTAFRLSSLITKLDTKEDWSKILSPGEQQKIAFSRAILHKPDWLFIDETTSALDKDSDYMLYTLLNNYLPNATIISIGQQEHLCSFHTKILQINETGEWFYSTLQ